jgi:hypothetical protein
VSSCGREKDRGDAALGSKRVKVGHERQKNNRPLRAAEGRALCKAIEDWKVGGKETIDADSGCGTVEEDLRPANGTCRFEAHAVHAVKEEGPGGGVIGFGKVRYEEPSWGAELLEPRGQGEVVGNVMRNVPMREESGLRKVNEIIQGTAKSLGYDSHDELSICPE